MGASNLIEDALATAMRASDGAAADVAPALRTATEVFPEARPAIEAHPSASPETKDLVNYLNTRQHLPMDAESLQQRAGDMNFSYDGYHGAPRDIHGFDNRYSGNQGWWGGHHYATTSPVDASENYAHPLGPDIINRIGAKQDELLNNFHPDDVKRWFKETRGIDLTPEEAVHHENVSAWSKAVAQDQLGITNSGAVYPVKMRMKNPVRVDSPNQTFWHHNVNFDDNGDITEEGGPAHDLMQHLNDQLHNYGMGEREVDKVMGNVGEHVVDNGGIDPQSLRQIMNDHAHYLTDENGEMVSPGHVLSEVFQKMGHDGIIMNTDHFAPSRGRIGMAGTGGNTQHYIVFDPKNIRSRFGAFDPFKSNSSRLSDARGGLVGRPAKGGGGSLEAALQIARDGLAGLARARGVTPREIGEPFGGILPRVPFEEWGYEATPNGVLLPRKEFNPESLKPGDVMIPLIGDRTTTGQTITSIAGKKLDAPVTAEGGPDFMRGPAQTVDGNVWKSDQGKVTKLNNRAAIALNAAREAGYKDPAAYGVYIAMGHDSGDFSTHTAEAMLGMLSHAKILKKDAAAFDRMMRAKDKNWPQTGILGPDVRDYVLNADAGERRKAFVQAMDAAWWRDKGFPDASLARFATTTPDLVTAPDEAAGYNIAKLSPGTPTRDTVPHRTYNTPMAGEYAGSLPSGVQRDDLFTQFSNAYDASPPAGNLVMAKRRAFDMSHSGYQVMHEPDIQNMIDYLNKVKSGDPGDGARLGKAGGGSAIAEAITRLLGPAERPGLMELTPKGSGYSSVPGKPAFVNIPSIGEVEARPIPQIMDSASSYMAARGMPGGHAIGAFPELDIENARRIAKAFANMKHAPDDPDVRRAYEALAAETMDQFKAAKDTGIDFTAIRGADPYAKSPAIGYADIAHRGNLSFFPTDAGFGSSSEFDPTKNPLLKRVGRIGDLDNATVNDAFRVVHDLYGHYGPGNPFFRGPGEERAYQLHRQMFSPDALPAMTTETRGQNSWLNYGPHEKSNASASSADTTYADQKTGIMPPWTYKADGGSISDAMRIAKDVGGALTAPQVMLTDANGVQYDQQGNVISQSAPAPAAPPATIQAGAPVTASPTPPTTAPTAPAPAPASPAMPQALQIAHQAVNDPALFDALMQQHLNPNADIKSYEKMRDEVARQPTNVQQATHLGAKPQRNVTVDAPLLGGTYNLGPEPYDTAAAKSLALQTLYDVKTAPFYSNPVTEPFALASDTAEGALTGDPLSAAMAVGFGPFGKYTKAAGLGAIGYLNSSNDAQAGPERWFSKLFEAARDLPMQKMGGEQALAMLRKVASPEEIRWTGTDAFLTNQTQVTKQDLIDYIEKNRLQLKEHTLGGPRKHLASN